MFLATLLILAGSNFILVAAYLCTRKIHYPFWTYVFAALLFWWPLAIFPFQFHAEKRMAANLADRQIADYKFRLAVLTMICGALFQGFTAIYLGRMVSGDGVADAMQLLAVAASFLMTLILLYSLRIIQKVARR